MIGRTARMLTNNERRDIEPQGAYSLETESSVFLVEITNWIFHKIILLRSKARTLPIFGSIMLWSSIFRLRYEKTKSEVGQAWCREDKASTPPEIASTSGNFRRLPSFMAVTFMLRFWFLCKYYTFGGCSLLDMHHFFLRCLSFMWKLLKKLCNLSSNEPREPRQEKTTLGHNFFFWWAREHRLACIV